MTYESSDARGALQPSHRGRWLQRTASVLLWTLLSLALYTAAVPMWFYVRDWQVVTLVSGSMSPVYPTGSNLIMVSVAQPTGVTVGSVITVDEGVGLPVTHRVVERVVLPSGVAYRLKGDANEDADPVLVRSDQVIGRIVGLAPWWSRMALWVEQTNLRLVVFGLPLSWLLALEVTTWVRQRKGFVYATPSDGGSYRSGDAGGDTDIAER